MSSRPNPFYVKKTIPTSKVTSHSPLKTSFSLFPPSSLQPKFDSFDIKNETYNEVLQYNVLNYFTKKVRKDDLVVFNTYPYKVSEDLKKIFNSEDNLLMNREKLCVSDNISIIKEVINKINLLNDVSKCIVEPDWDTFQKAASIIQANWRGYCKRKEFINNYLEHASTMKNVKFVKNYSYFNKKEPKYITRVELFSKIDSLTRHKKTLSKPLSKSPTSEMKTFAATTNNRFDLSKYKDDNADRFTKAAIKIQSDFRGHYVRHYYQKYQNSNLQATKIQALWRGYITRKKYELNVTMNSLNKLCQQNTFLIENIYKLINPYITPDNKLNLSLYEEKINNLTKQVNKLSQDNTKQAAEYEKNINRMVKERQKDKEEYLKQINGLKNNMEDMKREIYSIKKELNLPPLARRKNSSARSSIYENSVNGNYDMVNAGNGNNMNNNNYNNFGNNVNLINNNGNNGISNNEFNDDGLNNNGFNNNGFNNNGFNNNGFNNNGFNNNGFNNNGFNNNGFNNNGFNNNGFSNNRFGNNEIVNNGINNNGNFNGNNGNMMLAGMNSNINNDAYNNNNSINNGNNNNSNTSSSYSSINNNGSIDTSNNSSGTNNSSSGISNTNSVNNSNNNSTNANITRRASRRSCIIEKTVIDSYFNRDAVNNNFKMKKQLIDKIIHYKNLCHKKYESTTDANGNSDNPSVPGNPNTPSPGNNSNNNGNNKNYMATQEPNGMGRTNQPPNHPAPLQRANSNRGRNYEEFRNNRMNDDNNSPIINNNIPNSIDNLSTSKNNPNAMSNAPKQANLVNSGKSKNEPSPITTSNNGNGNNSTYNKTRRSSITKSAVGHPLSPQQNNHSNSNNNNIPSSNNNNGKLIQQNMVPNNSNYSPSSSGVNNDNSSDSNNPPSPSRKRLSKINTSPDSLNSYSNSALPSPDSSNKSGRPIRNPSDSPQNPSSPVKSRKLSSSPNHSNRPQTPSSKINTNNSMNSSSNNNINSGSVSPTSRENKTRLRSNTTTKLQNKNVGAQEQKIDKNPYNNLRLPRSNNQGHQNNKI